MAEFDHVRKSRIQRTQDVVEIIFRISEVGRHLKENASQLFTQTISNQLIKVIGLAKGVVKLPEMRDKPGGFGCEREIIGAARVPAPQCLKCGIAIKSHI